MVRSDIGKNCFSYLQYCLSIASGALFLIQALRGDLNGMLLFLFLFWLGNICYGLRKIKERAIFLLFHCAFFFFLMGRNVIELWEGKHWYERFDFRTNHTTLILLFLSLLFLLVGGALAANWPVRQKARFDPPEQIRRENRRKLLQILTLCLFLFCYIFLLMIEIDKLLFMQGKEYYQYYAEYSSRLPTLCLSIGALTKYIMCLFLCTAPSKRLAVPVLALHVLQTIPMFLIGQRNSFLSAVLFAFVYYCIRNYLDNGKSKWFNRLEKTAMLLLIPLGLAFLSLYENIRYGISAKGVSIGSSILNLFRSQGITYDVVAKGVVYGPELPAVSGHFTFGPWINYLKGNFLSFLFGTSSVRSQTLESALSGNSFADTISYLEYGDRYLAGAGLGSSYIIEPYLDFGFLGVIFFSFVLGLLLVLMIRMFGQNMAFSFAALNMLLALFMLPRSAAMNWTVFLVYIPMYAALALIFIMVGLLMKHYSGGKLNFGGY